MIDGADDFMGGHVHGDEMMTNFLLLVDGVPLDPTSVCIKTANKIELMTLSNLSAPTGLPNVGQIVAKARKTMTFNCVKPNTHEVEVEWISEENIVNAYLMMVPIKRYENDDSTGKSITDTQLIDFEKVDVSQANHGAEAIIGDDFPQSVVLFGVESGVSASVKVLKGWGENSKYITSGNSLYNKMYFSFYRNETMEVGQKMHSKAEFDVFKI